MGNHVLDLITIACVAIAALIYFDWPKWPGGRRPS